MRSPSGRLGLLLRFAFLSLLLQRILGTSRDVGSTGAGARDALNRSNVRRQPGKEAYVTLLYGDEFLLGVRVLGQSLRDTGTQRDMVVLTSSGVSPRSADLLKADGWILEQIELLSNPNTKRPARFWGVYTKLKIFNMTQYQKVVYLDADTIVVNSIEDLFGCRGFCANVKHSERLNSGVMVVEPSRARFDDMVSKIKVLPSYTGGDQGFLNSYFQDFINAPLFDPRRPPGPGGGAEFRLPTVYNADVGLYMLANKWMVDESELRVVHFTLGPLKPWDWWTDWLLNPVHQWQAFKRRLPASLDGTHEGRDPRVFWYLRALALAPLLVLLLQNRRCLGQSCGEVEGRAMKGGGVSAIRAKLWYMFKYKGPSGAASTSPSPQKPSLGGTSSAGHALRLPAHLGPLSAAVAFGVALVSFGVAMALVPKQVGPWTGLLLVFEWTFFLFGALFGRYLVGLRAWGRASAVLSGAPSEGAQEGGAKLTRNLSLKGSGRAAFAWDADTVFYFTTLGLLAAAVPALPYAVGVTSLFGRMGLIVAGGMVFSSYLTIAAEDLGRRWFVLGCDEWGQSKASDSLVRSLSDRDM